jgi:hypothetical protein
MCMFYRDYRKRMKERKDSGSWTMMRKKTQVECSHIMWDLASESEKLEVRSENNSASESGKFWLVQDFCGCTLRTTHATGSWLLIELLDTGTDWCAALTER